MQFAGAVHGLLHECIDTCYFVGNVVAMKEESTNGTSNKQVQVQVYTFFRQLEFRYRTAVGTSKPFSYRNLPENADLRECWRECCTART